jgi:anti-sigma B factor antagonist
MRCDVGARLWDDAARMELYYHELDRSVLILSADGGLNSDTAVEFVAQLESLVDAGITKIIVDCTSLSFISSYGIGALVRLHRKLAKHGGDVKIAAPPGHVLHALNVVRMAKLFGIYPDVNEARLAFRERDK